MGELKTVVALVILVLLFIRLLSFFDVQQCLVELQILFGLFTFFLRFLDVGGFSDLRFRGFGSVGRLVVLFDRQADVDLVADLSRVAAFPGIFRFFVFAVTLALTLLPAILQRRWR